MIRTSIPLVGFAAYSGVGKTTLLVRLIGLFRERGLRVGIIKHSHHPFEVDKPGKDSYELRKAGAREIIIGSSNRWALIAETEVDHPLQYYLDNLHRDELDLVMVEGFKHEAYPKIEIHRPILGHALLAAGDATIMAIATDEAAAIDSALPLLDLNRPGEIAEFIIEHIVTDTRSQAL